MELEDETVGQLIKNIRNLDVDHLSNGGNNGKRENRMIVVSNLNNLTKSETVYDVFSRFGNVFSAEIRRGSRDQPLTIADVEFHTMPRDFDINRPLTIDGKRVTMEYGKTVSEEQRPNYCCAGSLSLGILLTPTQFVEEWTTDMDVRLTVHYEKRRIKVDFHHLNRNYFMEIKFKNITNELKLEKNGQTTFLTIPLKHPAQFWRQRVNPDGRAATINAGGKTRAEYERANMIPLNASTSAGNDYRTAPTTIGMYNQCLRLGTWTVYRIQFNKSTVHLTKLLHGMADYNLVPRTIKIDTPPLTVIPANKLPPPITHDQRSKMLEFDVLYILEADITANYLMERNLDDKFYTLLASLDAPIACGILDLIAQDKKRVWYPMAALEEIWQKYGMKVIHKRRIPSHCSMLRKVIITPTTLYVQPPTLETTNRVVRHFSAFADRFIRVQFTDEDQMRISPSYASESQEVIYDRVFRTLRNGVRIGNRRYDYLGFSSSQLREHGCWYVAPYNEDDTNRHNLPPINADMIRSWMGDFSDIKIVAKYAARIGQCFSSTMPTLELEKSQVEFIEDIVRNGHTFSDGVGNISMDLAAQVSRRMSLRNVPCAFQFRLGGAKGVLMLSKRLTGSKVELRPSQIKFNSDHYMLEVIRYSSYISAYLNRQAITLLSALGVKDEIFMDMMKSVLFRLNRMLAHPDDAIKMLQANADEQGTSTLMASIIGAGFLDRQDAFIKNLLNMFRMMMLKSLKEKAKIPVEKGAFLFGVVDETGALKENEIFCQVSNEQTQTLRQVVQGKCLIWRNPCFHPGDIRVVDAVDHPSLHHLVDVVVFSGLGFRDIPSMCSGGDLDGDDYTIVWDQTLMPTIINHRPMDYTPEKPLSKENVTTKDIQKFFVNYINNDNLGQIANAHLATADISEKGAMDGRCKRLAQLHSMAVDFPKSGLPAKMSNELKVIRFPDFMSKEDKPVYKSKKVLGKMFRQIDRSDYDGYEATLSDEATYDIRLRVAGMEKYIASARRQRRNYNRDLSALMNQYGVKTEAEAISGYVIMWTKGGNKKSDYEVQKQMATAIKHLRQLWKEEFLREFTDTSPSVVDIKRNNNNNNNNNTFASAQFLDKQKDTQKQMEAKAAAWYYVTYHPDERIKDLSLEGTFFSFPWVMEDMLIDLGRRFAHRQPTDELLAPVKEELIRKHDIHENNSGDFQLTVLNQDDSDEDNDDEDDEDDEGDEDDEDGEDDEDESDHEEQNKNGSYEAQTFDPEDHAEYGGRGDEGPSTDKHDLLNFALSTAQVKQKAIHTNGMSNNSNENENNDNKGDGHIDSDKENNGGDRVEDDDEEEEEGYVISLNQTELDGTPIENISSPHLQKQQEQHSSSPSRPAFIPRNRDHQITVKADATLDELADALL